MPAQRTVFFISDRTGITAEMLGNSLLTQFDEFQFHRITIPFVDSCVCSPAPWCFGPFRPWRRRHLNASATRP